MRAPTGPAPVLIACPETLALVPTGRHAIDRWELPPADTLRDCPSCGGDHAWTPSDAVIVAI